MKVLHILLVANSGILFFVRGCLHWISSPALNSPWLRRLPHANDSLLLLTGLAMVLGSEIWNFSSPWLISKLCLLLAYILLGMAAFKWVKARQWRMTFWGLALLVFAFMVSVAVSKHPLGWFVGN
ncbi:MAG: SirB2 family protein [Gammaproteobacteria bacterium]|nr:SirB2 family protein [Gammaproteobacteria bacterium]